MHTLRRFVLSLGLLTFVGAGPALFGAADSVFIEWLRGDANDDGAVQQSDASFILAYLGGGSAPHCMDAADVDDNGVVLESDATYLLNFLYQGGPTPPSPGPYNCGPDPTVDYLDCASSFCE